VILIGKANLKTYIKADAAPARCAPPDDLNLLA
jgi:hypothetical protein